MGRSVYPKGFPTGLEVKGIPILTLGGKNIFVKPSTGSDNNIGTRWDKPVKTLSKALSLATEGAHDVVYLISESNTAANTTDYQSSTLDWNKDMVHLIGVGAPSPMSQRSRIAFTSTYDTASNLFTLSADNCIVANVQMFAGVAGTNPTGCLQVTGDRNVISNCHIAGIGNNANDIADAYSLYLNGVQETLFDNCQIGLNTIDAGTAANSEILMANTVKNVLFDNCMIYRRIEHATNHPLIKISAATSLDEFVGFRGCGFLSTSTNMGFSNEGVFKFVASPTQGYIFIDPTSWAFNGSTPGKWDVNDYDNIIVTGSPTPAADTAQLGRLV